MNSETRKNASMNCKVRQMKIKDHLSVSHSHARQDVLSNRQVILSSIYGVRQAIRKSLDYHVGNLWLHKSFAGLESLTHQCKKLNKQRTGAIKFTFREELTGLPSRLL